MSDGSGDPDPANAPTEVATPSEAVTAASEPARRRERPSSQVLFDLEVRLGDRYVIKELLGEGGMGAVYRAFDETIGEDVALKVVRTADATREGLRDELRLAQKVTHRNVCRTYDLEDIGGRYFLKMEYIAGETLAARLARVGRADVPEVVRVSRAISDGLAAAHAEGIVHRDLKPGNVMLAGDRVVLMDFGLALRPSGAETDGSGTPGYMSPEQLAGRAVDERSDLYALGCVAYELVTGERVTGSTDVRAKRPDTPRWLARAIDDLLALEPARRPRGARLLRRGPRSWKFAAALVIALAAAVLGLWRVWPRAVWHPEIEPILPLLDEDSMRVAISPDGKTLAFDSRRADARRWSIYTQSIAGGEPQHVTDDCVHPYWTDDGRSMVVVCKRGADEGIWELPVAGGSISALGSGFDAKPCGGGLVVVADSPDGDTVVWRAGGTDRVLALAKGGLVNATTCARGGELVAYSSGEPGELRLWERGSARLLVAGDAQQPVFTPGGRSIVFVKHTGQLSDLYELVLGETTPHQLTFGAQARAPEISRDGSVLVFHQDTTNVALFELAKGTRVQRTFRIEHLGSVTVSLDGRRIIAENLDRDALMLVDLATGDERELWRGLRGTISRDGNRVLYVDADARGRLLQRPIDDPRAAPTKIAELGGAIRAIVDAADGVHAVVDGPVPRAVVIGPDGEAKDEGADGLVIPSSSGWRAIERASGLRIVAPGQPLASPAFDLDATPGHPAWVNDHVLSYCDPDGCHVLDVATRSELSRVELLHESGVWVSASSDGTHWFSTGFAAHVTRKKLVNFASRPWAP